MVCTFVIPLLWEGKDVMNALGESCTAIHVIHNCAEYNLASQEESFCRIIVRGCITSLRQSLGSIARGENVVNAYEKV